MYSSSTWRKSRRDYRYFCINISIETRSNACLLNGGQVQYWAWNNVAYSTKIYLKIFYWNTEKKKWTNETNTKSSLTPIFTVINWVQNSFKLYWVPCPLELLRQRSLLVICLIRPYHWYTAACDTDASQIIYRFTTNLECVISIRITWIMVKVLNATASEKVKSRYQPANRNKTFVPHKQ